MGLPSMSALRKTMGKMMLMRIKLNKVQCLVGMDPNEDGHQVQMHTKSGLLRQICTMLLVEINKMSQNILKFHILNATRPKTIKG
jgi:hypothetical protein